jgi:hypothetical protein
VDPTIQTLAARVDSLERSRGRWRWLALAMGCAGSVLPLMGAFAPAKVIEATSFAVVDAKGKARAEFGMGPGAQPRFRILHKDAGDGVAMDMSMDEDGKNLGLVVFGRGGKGSALLQVREGNSPLLELDDPKLDAPIKLPR